ncbi:MAG: hypothetical protein LBR39_01320 [Coriobacteriales bacterium]|jgi:hypothetical protein|nr:hypothetical protein [Coriobacteriales bacterium]
MSLEREPQNGFDKSAAFYLDAAYNAMMTGQPRLAIHLFSAAFEVESRDAEIISADIITGLRKAWDLACELGERCLAESLFGDLLPFNDDEQTQDGINRLHHLALDQIEGMGLDATDLEEIASAITEEMGSADGARLADSLRSALEKIGGSAEPPSPQAIQKLPRIELMGPLERRRSKSGGEDTWLDVRRRRETQPNNNNDNQRLSYNGLSGFRSALEQMKNFGFNAEDSASFSKLVEQVSAMHGVSGLALGEGFALYGPSRADSSIFAIATAGEIGWPILHVHVELEKDGSGAIKLTGPFKRGMFGGPPDLMEMVTPCTVVIENIDHLQSMFNQEFQARLSGDPRVRGHGRSMQAEVCGYLRMLLNKSDVFLITTAEKPNTLKQPLLGIIGSQQEINIELPSEIERRDVWVAFAADHPSFFELDVDLLARLSEGLSRHDLVSAGIAAVESAYRESLRRRQYQKVSLGEVLMQLANHLDHSSEAYQRLEDVAVAQLLNDLDPSQL